eukprot:scaffold33253_cov160-Skeletonema_menzelii.AAC.3
MPASTLFPFSSVDNPIEQLPFSRASAVGSPLQKRWTSAAKKHENRNLAYLSYPRLCSARRTSGAQANLGSSLACCILADGDDGFVSNRLLQTLNMRNGRGRRRICLLNENGISRTHNNISKKMCHASLLIGVALLTSLAVSFSPSIVSVYPKQLQPRHFSSSYSSLPRLASTTTSDRDFDTDDTTKDDLTKEELLLRLSEVRSYYRERPDEGMIQEAVCLKLLCTRLQNLHLNRSFVATSTIPNAGYGLFASRDIKDGELITLYPGDALLSFDEQVVGDEGEEKSSAGPLQQKQIRSIMFGAHTKPEHREINRVLSHEAR